MPNNQCLTTQIRISPTRGSALVYVSFALLVLSSCGDKQELPVQSYSSRLSYMVSLKGPDNFRLASEGIFCGAEPISETDFAFLVKQGIRTIVSVDGSSPNLTEAKKLGLRYVHIPIGYDGIHTQASLSIVRAVKESNGPLYFHCHHGQHRGPAAAAIASIVANNVDADAAKKILIEARTDTRFSGLWNSVRDFKIPDENVMLPQLVESAVVDGCASQMVYIDRFLSQLVRIKESNWSAMNPDNEPSAANLAALIAEGLRESDRLYGSDYPSDFSKYMTDSERLAGELESAIHAKDVIRAEQQLNSLSVSCNDCHRQYRDELDSSSP